MASREIAIHATHAQVRSYQELLAVDWSMETLAQALDLFRATFASSGLLIQFAWQHAPARKAGRGPIPYPIPVTASEHLREFMERTNATLLPEVPETPEPATDPERLALQRRAIEAGTYLTLPNRLRLANDTEPRRLAGDLPFLRDVQSLIFNLVVHFLLEELAALNLADERSTLVNELFMHTVTVWDDDVAHQCYLRAMLFDAIGQPGSADAALLAAFRATGPDDHDYMTKAQTYWNHLIDRGDVTAAEGFAVYLARAVPFELLGEVRELMRATYEIIFRGRRTT
jgi:hypothetical protein